MLPNGLGQLAEGAEATARCPATPPLKFSFGNLALRAGVNSLGTRDAPAVIARLCYSLFDGYRHMLFDFSSSFLSNWGHARVVRFFCKARRAFRFDPLA